MVHICWFQKKHKKRSHKAEVEADNDENLMEDHEEIEGDNTPLTSPRDTAPPITLTNNVDQKQANNEKVH